MNLANANDLSRVAACKLLARPTDTGIKTLLIY